MVTVIRKGTPLKEIKKLIDSVLERRKELDLSRFSGALDLDLDPISTQKGLRDEWE